MLADAAPEGLYVEATMLDGARKAVELATMSDWSLARRGVPERSRAPAGRGSRPDRALGRGRRDRARRRHRRRSCRAPAARGRGRGGQLRPGAGHEAGRDLPGRGSPVRRQRLRSRRQPDRAAPLRRHRRRRRRDGARQQPPRRRRGHAVRERAGRGGREAPRPHARPLLHRGGVALVPRGGRARGRAGRVVREAAPARGVARPLGDARGRPWTRQGAARRPDRGRRVRRHEARPEGAGRPRRWRSSSTRTRSSSSRA